MPGVLQKVINTYTDMQLPPESLAKYYDFLVDTSYLRVNQILLITFQINNHSEKLMIINNLFF